MQKKVQKIIIFFSFWSKKFQNVPQKGMRTGLPKCTMYIAAESGRKHAPKGENEIQKSKEYGKLYIILCII